MGGQTFGLKGCTMPDFSENTLFIAFCFNNFPSWAGFCPRVVGSLTPHWKIKSRLARVLYSQQGGGSNHTSNDEMLCSLFEKNVCPAHTDTFGSIYWRKELPWICWNFPCPKTHLAKKPGFWRKIGQKSIFSQTCNAHKRSWDSKEVYFILLHEYVYQFSS